MIKNILYTYFFVVLFLPVQAGEWSDAKWIWQEEDGPVNSWMSFRKEFVLEAAPKVAIASIAVDSKYWLWVNGELVAFEGGEARGPSPAGDWDRGNGITPSNSWYENVDLAPHLRAGENTIAILVWYWGRETHKGTHIDSGKGGLLFSCEIGDVTIVSDRSWKSKQHPGYSTEVEPASKSLVQYPVVFDARNGMGDWTEYAWYTSGFDDGGWEQAIEKGMVGDAPWYDLIENFVPPLVNHGLKNYTNEETLGIPFKSQGQVVECRLPFNMQITPYLEVEAKAGDTIYITTDNKLNKITATYITREGVQSFESFSWMNGHTVRYTIPAGVKVKSLKYRWLSVGEMAGEFKISDPFYDRLWRMGNNTLFVCARDNFMDCPDRERALWIGDVADQTGYLFYSMDNAGRQLLKKAILQTVYFSEDKVIGALGPYRVRELVGQSLQFIAQTIWPYYLNTGDEETLRLAYPYVYDYLSLFPMMENGLPEYRKGKSPDTWDWLDWGEKNTIDSAPIQPAYYYMALDGAKRMAEVLGETGHVEWYDDRMQSINASYHKEFWQEGFYSSDPERFKDDRANALAIASGLAPSETYDQVVENVLLPNRFSSPHFEWVAEEAMCLAGDFEGALSRMKDQYESQVNNEELTTLYEKFPKGGSYNHAWNGSNTVLSKYIAGVRPTKPAWIEYEVKPNMVDFERIEVLVPTVNGNIEIELIQEEKSFRLDLQSEKELSALIGVPKRDQPITEVTANGILIWKKDKFKGKNSKFTFEENNTSHLVFKSSTDRVIIEAKYE